MTNENAAVKKIIHVDQVFFSPLTTAQSRSALIDCTAQNTRSDSVHRGSCLCHRQTWRQLLGPQLLTGVKLFWALLHSTTVATTMRQDVANQSERERERGVCALPTNKTYAFGTAGIWHHWESTLPALALLGFGIVRSTIVW